MTVELNLSRQDGSLTDAELTAEAGKPENFGQLEVLNLKYSNNITAASLMAVFEDNHNFTHVDLCMCSGAVNNFVILALADNNSQLKELDVSFNTNVGDLGLQGIARTNRGITKLNLAMLPHITDAGVVPLIESNPNIEEINLSTSLGVGNGSLYAMAEHTGNLKTINLLRNVNISPDAILAVGRTNPGLREVNLSGCTNITADIVSELREACPDAAIKYEHNIEVPSLNSQRRQELRNMYAQQQISSGGRFGGNNQQGRGGFERR